MKFAVSLALTLAAVASVQGQGAVTFSSIDYAVNESRGLGIICINIADEVNEIYSVTLQTQDVTAVNGEDYIGGTFTTEFPINETLSCFNITIIDDDEPPIESDEQFYINFISVAQSEIASVTIRDDCTRECQNGGTLDGTICNCTCRTTYSGLSCESPLILKCDMDRPSIDTRIVTLSIGCDLCLEIGDSLFFLTIECIPDTSRQTDCIMTTPNGTDVGTINDQTGAITVQRSGESVASVIILDVANPDTLPLGYEVLGTWMCECNNSDGRSVASSKLGSCEIVRPPMIVMGQIVPVPNIIEFVDQAERIGTDIHIIQGRTATIECQLGDAGLPPAPIEWTRNGMPLNQTVYPLTRGGETLVISDVSMMDEATYCCSTENVAGVSSACSGVFVRGGGLSLRKGIVIETPVNPARVYLGTQTVDIGGTAYAVQGSSLEVLCPVTFAEPPATTFMWTYIDGGMEVTIATHNNSTNMSMLRIGNTKFLVTTDINGQISRLIAMGNDTGFMVRCTATSPIGFDSATSAFSTFVAPIIDDGEPTDIPLELQRRAFVGKIGSTVHIVEGEDAVIDCSIIAGTGLPVDSVDYIWYYNGEVMNNDNFMFTVSADQRSSTLTDNFVRTDNGQISCVAFNPAGQSQVSSAVFVYSDVLIDKGNATTVIGPGESLTGKVGDKFLVSVGERACINCNLPDAGGFPYDSSMSPPLPADVQWCKDGEPVNLTLFSGSHGNQLCVDIRNANDSGNYECKATSRIVDQPGADEPFQMDTAVSNVMVISCNLTCQNGGTLNFDATTCTCTCVSSFSGDDCGIVMTNCPNEEDNVWRIRWPATPPDCTQSVACPGEGDTPGLGLAHRSCLAGGVWASVDATECESVAVKAIKMRTKEFINSLEGSNRTLTDDERNTFQNISQDLYTALQLSIVDDISIVPQDLKTVAQFMEIVADLGENNGLFNEEANETLQVVADILSSVLDERNTPAFEATAQRNSPVSPEDGKTTTPATSILQSTERVANAISSTLSKDKDSFTVLRPNLIMDGQQLLFNSLETGIVFPVPSVTLPSFKKPESLPQIQLPLAFLLAATGIQTPSDNDTVEVVNVVMNNMENYLPTDVIEHDTDVEGKVEDTLLASLVLSSQIPGYDDGEVDTNETVEVMFPLNERAQNLTIPSAKVKRYHCAFFNFTGGANQTGGWSDRGVETKVINDTHVRCKASHLTSFVVLVSLIPEVGDPPLLDYITYIGCSMSVLCLLASIIFFLSLRKELIEKLHNFVHLNLCIALSLGLLLFLTGIQTATANIYACEVVTALLHYFFLATFTWTLCEAVLIYILLVKVFGANDRKWIYLYMVLGWALPIPVVVITGGVSHDNYLIRSSFDQNHPHYENIKACWLPSGNGVIYAFIGPMVAIIVVNAVLLTISLVSLAKAKCRRMSEIRSTRNEQRQKYMEVGKYLLKATFILLPLLGFTWIIGLFAVGKEGRVFAYLFLIANVFQGLFIFLLHVVRHEKVYEKIKDKLPKCCNQVNLQTRNGQGAHTGGTGPGKANLVACRRGTNSAVVSEAMKKVGNTGIMKEGGNLEMKLAKYHVKNDHEEPRPIATTDFGMTSATAEVLAVEGVEGDTKEYSPEQVGKEVQDCGLTGAAITLVECRPK